MRKAHKIALWGLIAAAAVLLRAPVVGAQGGYPLPLDKYVSDYAGVLEPSKEVYLREMLADLDQKTGIEATVLTVDSIHDYDTGDTTIESFATNLFNTWGIGDRERNDGVLILVAVSDRKVRIELGSGYGEEYDRSMQGIIDDKMLPHFREGNYSKGICEGTQAVIDTVAKDAPLNAEVWPALSVAVLAGGFASLSIWAISRSFRRYSPGGRRGRGRGASYTPNSPGGGSSGGGGSFGGGSSSGGGASGGW